MKDWRVVLGKKIVSARGKAITIEMFDTIKPGDKLVPLRNLYYEQELAFRVREEYQILKIEGDQWITECELGEYTIPMTPEVKEETIEKFLLISQEQTQSTENFNVPDVAAELLNTLCETRSLISKGDFIRNKVSEIAATSGEGMSVIRRTIMAAIEYLVDKKFVYVNPSTSILMVTKEGKEYNETGVADGTE